MITVRPYSESVYEIDSEYEAFIRRVSEQSIESIKEHMRISFCGQPEIDKIFLEEYYAKYPFWGSLSLSNHDYTIFYNRAKAFVDHAEDFIWIFKRLGDYRSKVVLFTILKNWYSYETLEPIKEKIFPDYFDPDILKCNEDEVIVDLGAYVGDSVLEYAAIYGRQYYKKIYCYEITPDIFEMLKHNLREYPDIVYMQKGASDRKGLLYLSQKEDMSANLLADSGGMAVETVAIDDDIKEPITLIKMDIEGSEQKALLGSRRHIAEDKPKLAISVYHNNEDLWKIPRMIDEISEDYTFYLRYHGGKLSPSEISLLAVP